MNKIITDQEFRILAIKCQDGTATEEEIEAFEAAYTLLLKRYKGWDSELMGPKEAVKTEMFTVLMDNVSTLKRRSIRLNFFKYASAAILLLTLGIGSYFYFKPNSLSQLQNSTAFDVLPGSNKAVLTLADGKKIILTDVKNGELAKQTGLSITKSKDGQIIYKVTEEAGQRSGQISYNTIETPRGGQYEVVLQDGTKVWLNAGSSLKFPTSFVGAERKVELSGEGYFEVAHNKLKPFKVISSVNAIKQEIEVLGTQFNVNVYGDESSAKTTLLEGSVRINANGDKRVLHPGQQSVLKANGVMNMAEVDVEEAVAWKNGYFLCNDESMESIMRKVSRWYDVDVVYQSEALKAHLFSGRLSRYNNVSKVLKVIELTNAVHFKITNDKIFVVN
ncbi:hypothetical protein AQ505_09485 [Pedobacter sp. PACM 27299]|uniref:FecR family protein n=1 Tax=Pedobacter sp. PACM 27299 TaxID=1727164 RepID=UPI00070663AB|nr:FecR family protein [Pedobacter sp. PACM 27299]ALL05702.1 hypothetical protein AQ505_09485 [Pedobacter sp. PACM 27299]